MRIREGEGEDGEEFDSGFILGTRFLLSFSFFFFSSQRKAKRPFRTILTAFRVHECDNAGKVNNAFGQTKQNKRVLGVFISYCIKQQPLLHIYPMITSTTL